MSAQQDSALSAWRSWAPTMCPVHGQQFDLSLRCGECDRPLTAVPHVPCDDAAIFRGGADVAQLADWVFVRALRGDAVAHRLIAEIVLRAAAKVPPVDDDD